MRMFSTRRAKVKVRVRKGREEEKCVKRKSKGTKNMATFFGGS